MRTRMIVRLRETSTFRPVPVCAIDRAAPKPQGCNRKIAFLGLAATARPAHDLQARFERSYQMKDDIVIVSAVRTPVGAFNGAFATLPAHELGKVAVQESLKRAGVEPAEVSEVILGHILTAGQWQNPARQA